MSPESILAETEVLVDVPLESIAAPKETASPASPPPPQGDLTQLRRHLQSVRQQVEHVEGWVESSLCLPLATASDEGPGITALTARLKDIQLGLARIERNLNGPQLDASSNDGTSKVSLPKLASLIQESHKQLSGRLKLLDEKLTVAASDSHAAREALERAIPAPIEAAVAPEAVGANEPQPTTSLPSEKTLTSITPAALFGRELIDDSRSQTTLVELTQRLTIDDPRAVGFVGQLMSWRSASRERIPKMLGELGDAYYACFPRTSERVAPLEQALVEILARKCLECEVPNSIELVQFGERFDPSRHRMRAGERGAEVSEIYGWVVVGPDGQILNRAHVGVK